MVKPRKVRITELEKLSQMLDRYGWLAIKKSPVGLFLEVVKVESAERL